MDIPYHSAVEPIVPDANRSLAPEIVTRGLASLAQMALAREKAQLEAEQMTTDAALKSRQLDISRENNLLDFKVGMKNADALQDYHRKEIGIQQENADSLKEFRDRNSAPDNPFNPAFKMKKALQKEQDWVDFNTEFSKAGLDESNPKNPVDYHAKFQRLYDGWQFSTDPRVKHTLEQIKRVTEQHTIPLKDVAYDESGAPITIGEPKKRPVGQIMENLNDPEQAQKQLEQLRANNLTVPHNIEKPVSTRRDYFVKWLKDWSPTTGGKDNPLGASSKETTQEGYDMGPQLSTYAKMAAGVDFSRGKPKTFAPAEEASTPVDAAPSITQSSVDEAAQTMADEASAGTKSSETLFPPTETDKIMAQARRAAARPGANIDGIKAALQAKGIDPSQLDSQ